MKTERFRASRYVGDPINAIRIFNEKEVDELMVLDIDATRSGAEPQYALIERLAGECFMPLAYGGGVRTLEQARRLFRLGVEKICLQSAVLARPRFVSEVAEVFGSQSVVVSIDVRRTCFGRPKVFDSVRRRNHATSLETLLSEVVSFGAGEILLTSVDREGTLSGPDLALIGEVAPRVSVPLVAAGGISCLEDIRQAVLAGASAVAAGAFFVFHGPHRAVLITYPGYSALEELFR